MKFKTKDEKYNFDDLVRVVEDLRAPGGCPWDIEQTHESIKRNLIEEGYELIEAIDSGIPAKIADESGDLLLQVVFHAVIGKSENEYDIDDVTDAVCRKLIHRHPHVFGDVQVSDSSDVLKNWDAIKRADRGQDAIADELSGVSKYLPSLMRAEKIQKKAQKAGYDFDNNTNPTVKIDLSQKDFEGQCGKMLFEAVQLCRNAGVDPEIALTAYNEKFIEEFREFEKTKD